MTDRNLAVIAIVALSAASAAVAAVKPNTPTPMPQVRAQMKQIVDKTSTELFNIAGAADPANGPDQELPDAAGWAKLKIDADKLKDVADWMQTPTGGKVAEANWMKSAKTMSALSGAASRAAAAHDATALAKSVNDLSDTCSACHSIYKKQS